MSITAVCNSCGRRFQAPPAFVGKRVKCKGCGTIFQIKDDGDSAADPGDTDLDALASMERSAAGTASPVDKNQRSRISTKNEKHLSANPLADEIAFSAPSGDSSRPNYMWFDYPGARPIDQWLPLGILLLGFIGLAGMASGQETHGITWIAMCRFGIPVLLYWAVIFPMVLTGLRKAGAELHYRPPPNPKLRTFAIYTPAFVLATGLWLTGEGSITALVLGAVIGLLLSSGALFLLYRLKEEELAVSVAYGAGGFLAGLAICVGLILGLNWVTMLSLRQGKVEDKVPASPFGPGLAWIVQPPPPVDLPHPKIAVAASAPVAPVNPGLTSTSALVTDVSMDTAAGHGPTTGFIPPLTNTPVIALLHEAADRSVTIDSWDTASWHSIGTELKLSSSLGQYALSPDGQMLAYLDRFPKLCAKVWSFTTGAIVKRVDLNPANGEPKLIGFAASNRLMVHWNASPDNTAKQQPWTIEVLDTDTPKQLAVFTTPPLEAGPAPIAVCTATARMAIATKVNGTPCLMQYSLDDATQPTTIPISEIDPSIPIAPTGLAYSDDGKRLTALFEYGGGAVMPVYDAITGTEMRDLEFASWPPAGVSVAGFSGNAVAWLQGRGGVLVYGQSLVDVSGGKSVGTLGIAGVNGQRVVSPGQVNLMVDFQGAKRVAGVKMDTGKLDALIAPTPGATTAAAGSTSAQTTSAPATTAPAGRSNNTVIRPPATGGQVAPASPAGASKIFTN